VTRSAATFFLTMLAGPALAQVPEAPAAATPTPTPLPPIVSPEVHSDRRVTFRLRYPAAKAVVINGEWSRERPALAKDAVGDWVITLGPLEPGVYGYGFIADGFQMVDPLNSQLKLARQPRTSVVEVPGATPLIDAFRDVPHGVVHQHTYVSKSLGRPRGLVVYTPPGYEKDAAARFPVLYMLHGNGDNEQTWVSLGRAHWILDNVLAEKKALPFVLALVDSHPIYPTPSTVEGHMANALALERDLLEDVVPYVEAHYRVKAEPRGRALAGVSMGGAQTLLIGLRHTDVFAWVLGLSGDVRDAQVLFDKIALDAKVANDRLAMLWMTIARSDSRLETNQKLADLLKAKGVTHTFDLHDGAHNWPQWRVYLAQLAPRLFVDTKPASR
jgi:enterochelin esterase-like enzyme